MTDGDEFTRTVLYGHRNLDTARIIERACREFEDAWKRGERPRVEDRIEELEDTATRDDTVRDLILEELLLTEIELRIAAGETPSRDEYLKRLPQSDGIVSAVFEELSGQLGPGPLETAQRPFTVGMSLRRWMQPCVS